MPVPLATRLRDGLREVVLGSPPGNIWCGSGRWTSKAPPFPAARSWTRRIPWRPSAKCSVVTFGAAILPHDYVNRLNRDVYIGDNCFIGAHSIVLPGVTIGDGCIVAAASVVARDVPAGSLVAGNPARIVERNIQTTHYGVRMPPAV